ncbi:phosphoadenosine phosphosulfate reductase family protein [Aliarcobacter cryaerophilus]|uniref:phosphoadenosine phosphosulfate reductase family protein n=1 Tax=Aliarcobacter cryaerophilus TaxID=28198 RepID=UPI0021B686F7|nr:phosphoadenosine phosphosulfate reductase family protein [Aliarcobacter cryaerophilus]MCT7528774.1 phosphoadenosine phosphosulfate reductase family protein [Aliarcobacter cryaerophilus]
MSFNIGTRMLNRIIILVSVSGGKDSQATANYILKKHKRIPVVLYFADTGWEAKETYKHLDYLEATWNKKIHRIKSKKYNGMEDLAKKRGFPNRLKRFCTEELKIIPSNNFIKQYQEQGYTVINVVGVRNDESKSQKLKKPKIINGVNWLFTPKRDVENKWKFSFFYPCSKKIIKAKQGVLIYQPILNWTAKQVLEYNLKCGTRNNPLYSQGRTRVGCEPCVECGVREISDLAIETVLRITKLEQEVSELKGKKCVFYHKGGELQDFNKLYTKYKYKHNALDLDFGCINQFGICE